MILGYARVSKGEAQDTRMQETALRAAGVERLFTEQASGGRWDRPHLHRLLDHLRPGDVVVTDAGYQLGESRATRTGPGSLRGASGEQPFRCAWNGKMVTRST